MLRRNPIRHAVAVITGTALACTLLGTSTAWADTSTGSISGLVWFDRNSDHQQDNGEPGDGGSTVKITSLADGTTTTVTTDFTTGSYTVNNLRPGIYRVNGAQAGYVSTTALSVWVRVVAAGQATANFGVRGGTIVGNTWNDSNGDGIRQPSEAALAGVSMLAQEPAQSSIAVATSDASGNYRIEDLAAGTYQLSLFSMAPGFGLTQSGGDSVLDPLTGIDSTPVQVHAGERVGPLDAGFIASRVDTAITSITVPDQLHVGDQVSVDVAVANLSNVPVQLLPEVNFPTGMVPVSATATDGLPAGVSGQIAFAGSETSPAVPADTTVHLVVLANVTATLSNAAIVASTPETIGDVNTANNSLTQLVDTVN